MLRGLCGLTFLSWGITKKFQHWKDKSIFFFMYRRRGGTKLSLSFVSDVLSTFPTHQICWITHPFPDRPRIFLPLSLCSDCYDRNAVTAFLCRENASSKSSSVISLMPFPALPYINKSSFLRLQQLDQPLVWHLPFQIMLNCIFLPQGIELLQDKELSSCL